MGNLRNMPLVGIVVIILILALFILSLVMLFSICASYRRKLLAVTKGETKDSFLKTAAEDYAAAYKQNGKDVNTPAIIENTVASKMGTLLFCERFLNNAVSLFVTLGLFGTFLGLSLSVSSLTKLISFSDTSEWLNVLDSVGGGLMSALSGMGVAFYTSLVGVACSIILTILRAVFSPENMRSDLQTSLELWLDHNLAPKLKTDRVSDDRELIALMVSGFKEASDSVAKSLKESGLILAAATENNGKNLDSFNKTVEAFNKGVRDFSEFDYNLRGTVERMDLAVRDFSQNLKKAGN